MPVEKTCPSCGAPLTFIGACGIADVDGRWDLEVMRWVCPGDHMIFIGDRKRVEEAEVSSADGEER